MSDERAPRSHSAYARDVWEGRGKAAAFFHTCSSQPEWTEEDFYVAGEREFASLCAPLLCRMGIVGGTALEIGSGPGRVTMPLSGYFDKVYASDISESMTDPLRSELARRDISNVDVALTDGSSFPHVPSGSVDFVFSTRVFIHMPTKGIVHANLREIARVLKPTGAFQIHLRLFDGVVRVCGLPVPRKLLRPIPRPVRFALLWMKRLCTPGIGPRSYAYARGTYGVSFTRVEATTMLSALRLDAAVNVHDGITYFESAGQPAEGSADTPGG